MNVDGAFMLCWKLPVDIKEEEEEESGFVLLCPL
jgi:hypothetical protein